MKESTFKASVHIPPINKVPKMNFLPIVFSVVIAFLATGAQAADGLISLKSPYSAKETLDRFEGIVKQRGLNIFARIDHAAGAAKIGKTIRPTELLIFGNPQGGTPFMECAQTVGIDLPLKALAWEDAAGQVWLGYNDPAYLAKRHATPTCPAAAGMAKALSGISEAVVAK
jgi:uncharacterized protein (DUF302 family)